MQRNPVLLSNLCVGEIRLEGQSRQCCAVAAAVLARPATQPRRRKGGRLSLPTTAACPFFLLPNFLFFLSTARVLFWGATFTTRHDGLVSSRASTKDFEYCFYSVRGSYLSTEIRWNNTGHLLCIWSIAKQHTMMGCMGMGSGCYKDTVVEYEINC